ncbi:glycosyltransferase family 4 protein [Cryobacterium ruanii]|uniref:D-inositol 3-phosphate glycosyltransferase n=1 Tax=Cryobacterium ruanii TaxID=1259197 RepID=A0A4R9ASW6_9MICO|nr:glycosyltransferase family 4 protein [Cryobacterium ruanii]TFD69367.1 glycosyltransferase [Cryobacterium ruanii]
MRIVVVNNFFPPRPGGSSHLADHLAKKYAAAGHDVLVLTASYKDAAAEEFRDGLSIVRIPAWSLPKTRFAANFDIAFTVSYKAKRTVYDILDRFEPDVIHQHGQFFDLTWLSGAWARKHAVPTLLSIHTRLYSPSPVNNLIYRTADAILVNPLMKLHRPMLVVMDVLMDQYIHSRYRRSISGKTYIPVGIDPTILRGGNADLARKKLGLGSRHILLSLGHVIPQRSRMALVEALPRVLESYPDVAVVVIGKVYHDEFLHRAKELGVEHAILAVGALPQSEVPDYLAAADLEVHELEGQGFGTASLEALAVGIPVVAAIRSDNFVEFELEDRRHLFIAPFFSSKDERADPTTLATTIMAVLADPAAARTQVAEHAQKLIDDHFTIDIVARKHLSVLTDLVAVER